MINLKIYAPMHQRVKSKYWSKKEEKILKRLFSFTSTSKLAKMFKCSYGRIANKAYAMKLKKSKKYLHTLPTKQMVEAGKKFRFKKGQQSHNKGKIWDDYMSKESQNNARKTTFKKGNIPPQTNPNGDGAISLRYHNGRIYKFIRVSLGKWMPLHVYNWEKKHGKVPKGYIVIFKTKNTENCNVSNLKLISRAENMQLNTIHRYPKEIKSTIRTLSKLRKTIYGKEQDSRPAQPSF